ncbi:DNA mismatch repair protein MutS [Eubacteriales bacterium OttesenSCG-928-N13]|nr:DNA mismatch repair protein MutS [Eubacteriales bacterium OttesenSCG-928-N13]
MAITPMMQQYLNIKEQHQDAILFFRLGDFYEMFFDDAHLASKELELTLTGKDCGLSERAPMCGVPFHSADVYISRLIAKGYRVAICEQVTDPLDSKGLVERAVVRVVTPGTVIETDMLDEQEPSYIMAVFIKKQRAGIAFCDVSTGEFYVYETSDVNQHLVDEISRIAPRELLSCQLDQLDVLKMTDHTPLISELAPESFEYAKMGKQLAHHFGYKDVAEMELTDVKLAVSAAAALMQYLSDTQKNALGHIMQIRRYEQQGHLTLDRVASLNLELTQALRTHSRKGSLLWLMDKTITSMGSRMLRSWIEQPLQDQPSIEGRLDAVASLKDDIMRADALRDVLKSVYDIERLLSKIAYDTINARDCLSLNSSLKAVPEMKQLLSGLSNAQIEQIQEQLDPMDSISMLLEKAISEDAPLSVKDGGMIKQGYSEELDKLRSASTDGKNWLAALEQQEREATGIKNLKIGFNRVFGYYIEVTKSFYELVPYRYARKQTLANCERFVTQELKEIEKSVLGAEDNAVRLEFELFTQIRTQLKTALSTLSKTAQGIKTLDALLSLAQVAIENGYSRPKLNDEGRIHIVDGRHPVVEQSIGQERFVPNDTELDMQSRVMIITGPNMAGKSTYMRQVALIVLMAHMGSFVPAKSADIPLTDRIFTRVGASDDLYGGQSTFMVEMTELASILKHATPKSLLILDEVGRGTSTFDGLSIAWAAVEHIAGPKCGAKTLFATHYHELSELEGQLEGVVDYRITAKEHGDDVIFLRKIVRGGADRSYGVAVASLAGLPNSLISRARQIMARLEVGSEFQGGIGKSILNEKKNTGNRQVELIDYRPMELVEEIQNLDVLSMSPIDALNTLFSLSEKARHL